MSKSRLGLEKFMDRKSDVFFQGARLARSPLGEVLYKMAPCSHGLFMPS